MWSLMRACDRLVIVTHRKNSAINTRPATSSHEASWPIMIAPPAQATLPGRAGAGLAQYSVDALLAASALASSKPGAIEAVVPARTA